MTVAVIVALAIAWIVVLSRGRGRVIDPVRSVDRQRRALDAIATAAQTARRSRRSAAREAGATSDGADGRWARRGPIVSLAVVTAVSLGVGFVMLPEVREGDRRARPDRPSAPRGSATTASTTASTTTTPTTTTAPPLRSQVIGGDLALQHVEVARAGFELTVEAERPCWVQVRTAADAPVTYEETLLAGTSSTFPADTTLWVRLGAPDAVRMRVDGEPLAHATGGDTPVDLTFAVAAGAPG